MKKTVQLICLVFLACSVFLLSNCSNKKQTTETEKQNAIPEIPKEAPDTLSHNYPVRYEGVLPSAENPNVKTILCISTDYTHFRLAEKNTLGPPMPHITIAGHMNTERGYEKDDDATVYILNDDMPGKEQYIMVRKTGSNDLLLCDEARKIIGPAFVLKKVP